MMKFTLQRDDLLKSLQIISGVIEKKQTKAILANVLLKSVANKLFLTATDTTIELISHMPIIGGTTDGAITVPGRKLYDLCRSLPEDSSISINYEPGGRFTIKTDTSRFILASLPADDFPVFSDHSHDANQVVQFTIPENVLYQLLRATCFAMAHEDIRKYLNGAIFCIADNKVEMMAADGHRFALSYAKNLVLENIKLKTLIPRKTSAEIMRSLNPNNTNLLQISITQFYIRIVAPEFSLTSKLVYTAVPNYQKLIPAQYQNTIVTSRSLIQQALQRVSILSHEKLRSIIWELKPGQLILTTDNPEREEAEEIISINYSGPETKSYFNVSYLLDVLNTIESEQVNLHVDNLADGLIITPDLSTNLDKQEILSTYIVMPLSLSNPKNQATTA